LTVDGLSVTAAPNISRDGEPIHFHFTLDKPAQAQLSLFTLTGELVYKTSAEGNTGANILTWDLNNQGREKVASGLYLYVLQAADGTSKIGKLVVIR
jgi:hypothetical protein